MRISTRTITRALSHALSLTAFLALLTTSSVHARAPQGPIGVSGSYSGSLNGTSISGTATGTFDPSGAGNNDLSVTFSSIPGTFHPYAIGISVGTIICWGATSEVAPAQNLFHLSGGNYTISRAFTWPSLPGDSLQVSGTASTMGSSLSYAMQIVGTYSGPTDLTGVSSYSARWVPLGQTSVQETGSALVTRTGGPPLVVEFTTTYSNLATTVSGPQVGTLSPVVLSYSGAPAHVWHLNWVGSVAMESLPGTPFCSGDGSGTACPCGNTGATGNGCASSVNANGANLSSSGAASISADSVAFQGSGMPNSSALYFQGTAQASAVFGDGLRCAGGTVIRLGTKTNVGGASGYPTGTDQAISVRGACGPGDVRHYQCWYRNAASFCTASTFNLTNGISITWQP
jgi:hypothetical protein